MNENTLVPVAVETAVKPKPTKTEIIEALARLKIQQIQEANKERRTKRARIAAKANKLMLREAKTGTPRFRYGYRYTGKLNQVEVEFTISNPSDALLTLLNEYHDCEEQGVPTLKWMIKSIKSEMSGAALSGERVALLLSDKASREALEEMLNQIGK